MTKRLFVVFVLALAVLIAIPGTVAAQYRGYNPRAEWLWNEIYGGGYRNGSRNIDRDNIRSQGYYGDYYYEPAYLKQMFSLPEGLMACQMSDDNKRVVKCHHMLKTVNYMEGHAERHEDLNERLGTLRTKNSKEYLCSFDDTDHRIGRAGVTAIGAGTGAAVGGVFGGGKGAVIGGVGGAFAGWLASWKSKSIDKCLPVVGNIQSAEWTPTVERTNTSQSSQPTSSNSGKGITLQNEGGDDIAIYDGDQFVTTLAAGGTYPAGSPRKAYRGVVKGLNERGEPVMYELGRRLEGKTTLVFTSEAYALPNQ